MAKKNYKVLRNVTIAPGAKETHVHAKKGEVQPIEESYVEEHLNPLDPDEEHDPKLHHEHFVQETDELPTAEAKVEEKKKKKLSKEQQKAADKKAKEDAKAEKKADKE